MEVLTREAKEKNLSEDDVYESIQELTREGDIYEPQPGHFSKL